MRNPGRPIDAGSDAFFAQVYTELRAIAHARMRNERAGQTIQSTELVHEAYLRLRPAGGEGWQNPGHFFAAAAQAMRRILLDRARARSRAKRGGDSGKPASKVPLNIEKAAALADDRDPAAILDLDRAIGRLTEHDARAAQVVMLRFYAGLSVEEIAGALAITPRTVLRDWAFARAWLYDRLATSSQAYEAGSPDGP
jgi:RNA polymerase sigma factor (TIGR02999 family)